MLFNSLIDYLFSEICFQQVAAPMIDTSDMDPELARYLNRNYWQQKHEEIKVSTTQPSAPVAAMETKMANNLVKVSEVMFALTQ